MGAKLTKFIHVKMVSCWTMVSCYLMTPICKVFHLTLQYCGIPWLYGVDMVSHGQPSYNTMVDIDTNMVNHVSTLFVTAGIICNIYLIL